MSLTVCQPFFSGFLDQILKLAAIKRPAHNLDPRRVRLLLHIRIVARAERVSTIFFRYFSSSTWRRLLTY